MSAFSIQQLPDGQWRLTKSGIDMGIFTDLLHAEDAMRRIIANKIFHYDENGVMIE